MILLYGLETMHIVKVSSYFADWRCSDSIWCHLDSPISPALAHWQNLAPVVLFILSWPYTTWISDDPAEWDKIHPAGCLVGCLHKCPKEQLKMLTKQSDGFKEPNDLSCSSCRAKQEKSKSVWLTLAMATCKVHWPWHNPADTIIVKKDSL